MIQPDKLNFPEIRVGNTIKVHQKIKEGDKTRIQVFEGLIISKRHGNEPGATITVRKISQGIGVERTYPLFLPTIEKIEVVKSSKVRRAKLYYLRDKTSSQTKKKLKTKKALIIPGQEIIIIEKEGIASEKSLE